jgi:hypothetical protein
MGAEKFKEKIMIMKQNGETHFTCNVCKNQRSLNIVSSDRMICKLCIIQKQKDLHAHIRPEDSPDGNDCTVCGVKFSRTKFAWRYELGHWRFQCNECTRLKYDCPMCGLFKVPTPMSLCYVDRKGTERGKRFDIEMKECLDRLKIEISYQDQVLPCAKPGSLKRPDFVLVLPKAVIIIEVDEHYHMYYSLECELKRIEILHEQVKLPLVLVRFNPHSRHYGLLEKFLKNAVKTECQMIMKENHVGVHIQFFGYPKKRIEEMKDVMECDIGAFFPYSSIGEIK